MAAPSPWCALRRRADRRPRLLSRNAIAAGIRAWLAVRDFIEVDTAIPQVSPGRRHLCAFSTEAIRPWSAPAWPTKRLFRVWGRIP